MRQVLRYLDCQGLEGLLGKRRHKGCLLLDGRHIDGYHLVLQLRRLVRLLQLGYNNSYVGLPSIFVSELCVFHKLSLKNYKQLDNDFDTD